MEHGFFSSCSVAESVILGPFGSSLEKGGFEAAVARLGYFLRLTFIVVGPG